MIIKGEPITQKIINRFWSKVKKTDGCWEWQAGTDPYGYGKFHIAHHTKNEAITIAAHRFSKALSVGAFPESIFGLHKCDNPACVNPDHIFLGTKKENMDDKISKGRAVVAKGEDAGKAKLNEKQVLEIRTSYMKNSLTHGTVALGRKYGVSPQSISNILSRKNWKHI